MSYNILAINPGHNGSVAFVVDGTLVYYCEEERISRMKYDGNPFRGMLQVIQQYTIDELVIGGTSAELAKLPWTMEDAYTALVRKFHPNVKVTNMGFRHHLGHAASAFYNSGFDTAMAIIVDGAGSFHTAKMGAEDDSPETGGFETESIYKCSYPGNFEPVFKNYSNGGATEFNNGTQYFNNTVTVTKAYEAVSNYLGFGFIEAGKTMGLAPYGKEDKNIPDFFENGKGNEHFLKPYYPAGALVDEDKVPYLRRTRDPKEWHSDFSKCTDKDKNLAWKVQETTQEIVGNLIQAAASTGEKNIVIAGGYGLNCVANYYYLQRFPDLNIYVDPVSHDGGTAIGLAYLAWFTHSNSTQKSPLTTLYLGTRPNYNNLQGLLQQNTTLDVTNVTPSDIATLIINQNIVAMFQGGAEGGPRALGNRSILFDPRAKDGKDFVNKVKGREWFRPFAGSVLEEHAHDWFEMRTLISSPYMMYAVNVQTEKLELIPAVTHVDGTCRVQTVNESDNKHYYELIKAFYKETNVPVLFNTSFNLAGDPLVDTLKDAIDTILKCDIKYLYLPEIGKLITKK